MKQLTIFTGQTNYFDWAKISKSLYVKFFSAKKRGDDMGLNGDFIGASGFFEHTLGILFGRLTGISNW